VQSLSNRLKSTRFKLMLLIVVALALSLVLVVLYSFFLGQPSSQASPSFTDPSGDVSVSAGTSYPAMIDIVGAKLEATGNTLNVTINLKDKVSSLGEGETASWTVIVILENATDALKTYQFQAVTDSSGMLGSVVDLESENVTSCPVNVVGNSLGLSAVVDGLQIATQTEWQVISFYQMLSGDQVVASASDSTPDNGLQTTIIEG
jgi:hypothetical protein